MQLITLVLVQLEQRQRFRVPLAQRVVEQVKPEPLVELSQPKAELAELVIRLTMRLVAVTPVLPVELVELLRQLVQATLELLEP